jgi:hypothetical protein
LRDYWKPVPALVDESLDREQSYVLREWRKYAGDITRVFGSPEEFSEILQALDQLVIAAHEAGVLGGVDSRTSWEDQRRKEQDLRDSIEPAINGLDSYDEMSYWDKIRFLANDYGPVLAEAAELAGVCQKVTVSTKENLEHQADTSSHHIGVREDLKALVENLEDALTNVGDLS